LINSFKSYSSLDNDRFLGVTLLYLFKILICMRHGSPQWWP